MIFYNFSGFFGKRKSKKEEDEKPSGPDTGYDYDVTKWFWLILVEKMCNKLNYKPDEVYDLNYISCLNWLSKWKEDDLYMASLQKQK